MQNKFTQSLLKDLLEYQKDEMCGLIFKQKWVYGEQSESSQVMEYGHYFEFMATGSLPKDGKIPKPKFYKKGERKGEITEGYQIALAQAKYFKEILNAYGIKLLKKGRTLKHDEFEGTLDIEASFPMYWQLHGLDLPADNPEGIVIIDLKFSGLLDDRKNPFSWDLKTFPYKLSPKIQCIHYSWLYKMNYGFVPPFMFWVFDSGKPKRARIINAGIIENDIIQHEIIVTEANDFFKYMKQIDGFEPKPEYERCFSCALKDSCAFKIDIPPIINVNFE